MRSHGDLNFCTKYTLSASSESILLSTIQSMNSIAIKISLWQVLLSDSVRFSHIWIRNFKEPALYKQSKGKFWKHVLKKIWLISRSKYPCYSSKNIVCKIYILKKVIIFIYWPIPVPYSYLLNIPFSLFIFL